MRFGKHSFSKETFNLFGLVERLGYLGNDDFLFFCRRSDILRHASVNIHCGDILQRILVGVFGGGINRA